MRIILFGAPGAGKGTQASALQARLGIPTVSTGNLIREAIARGTEDGLAAKRYTDRGELVPDAIVVQMLAARLAEPDCANGCIFDGFPRTIPQAELLEQSDVPIDAVLSLEVHDAVIEERMSGRRVCKQCGETYHIAFNPPPSENVCGRCGGALGIRADDAAETVRERLRVYHAQTEPVKDFYRARGMLAEVDGCGTVEEITAALLHALGIRT